MRRQLPRLDTTRLRERRLELRIAETVLARMLGVSPMTVRRLELDGDPINHDLKFLTSYAAAIDVPFDRLFAPDGDEGDAETASSAEALDDVARVGAVVSGSAGRVQVDALAEALGWTIERTRAALDALGAHVGRCGMRLLVTADGDATLVPVEGETDVIASHGVRFMDTVGVNETGARALRGLLVNGPTLNPGSPQTMRRLMLAGMVDSRVTEDDSSDRSRLLHHLTDRALFDLCLDDTSVAERHRATPPI